MMRKRDWAYLVLLSIAGTIAMVGSVLWLMSLMVEAVKPIY